MLTLTEGAAGAVREILAASPQIDDESGGVRVTTAGETFQLSLAAGPHEDDQVIEAAEGARVFLEAQTAQMLHDKQLDATVEGDRFFFTIADQES